MISPSQVMDINYFFKFENNKELEDGKCPEAAVLLHRIRETEIWEQFIKASFDVNNNELNDYFQSPSLDVRSKLFEFGISCFVYFIQANFTGPQIPEDIVKLLENSECKEVDFSKLLAVNDDEINVNVQYPVLLLVSKVIFEKCCISNSINSLWKCRTVMIHQKILDEVSPLLSSQAEELLKQIDTSSLEGDDKAKFDIEAAQLYLTFKETTKAKEHLCSADNILGVKYDLVGKLGRRTKFQKKDIAQLTLEISLVDNGGIHRPPVHEFDIPKIVPLEDEIKLDNMTFSEEPAPKPEFSNTEQKLFLSKMQETLMSKPKHELQNEEVEPFVDLILTQNNTWSVRIATLLLRCKLEVDLRRPVLRTTKQCGEILKTYRKSTPHVLHRVADVFGTGLAPKWKVQAQYADVLLNEGYVLYAADAYKRVQLWEQVILCYRIQGNQKKAEEIIRQQLAVKPTVELWYLLGDAIGDTYCYEMAWKLSKEKCYKTQRHWGNFYYFAYDYQESIPHFEKSLSINPHQYELWLRLGHAAFQIENWQLAITAYKTYTKWEPDGFQGWNNLAIAHLKIGDKKKAHQAFLEAVKYNFDNWQIWDNILTVSCDIMDLSHIIKAYNKILDLRGRHWNVEALHLLVFSLCEDDSEEVKSTEVKTQNESANLPQRTKQLLNRVSEACPEKGVVWELHARLVPPSVLQAQMLQKAIINHIEEAWENCSHTCVRLMRVCIKLAKLILTDGIDDEGTVTNSVKLTLNSTIALAKKRNWEDARLMVEEASVLLEEIKKKVQEIFNGGDIAT